MSAQATLNRAIDKLRSGQHKFEEMVKEYDKKVTVLENKMVTAANMAATKVQPTIARFLAQNLQSSGLNLNSSKDSSMHLSDMVAQVQVRLKWKGPALKPTGMTLIYELPAGLAEKNYKKISSLNYGAVRTNKANRGAIGEKRKRSLKRALWNSTGVISGQIGARRAAWLGKAKIDITQASFKGKSIHVGGFSATRAWKFYHLTETQRQQVVAEFTAALADELTSIPD